MKIAILGFAGQGQSAYEYWNTPENELTICDLSPDIAVPEGVHIKLGEDYLKDLAGFDRLVRTPAIHPKDIQAANPEAPGILDKVTSVTNEFFRVSPSKNIIGVTGTKGKGTTSTLITSILEADGKTVHLGGNIGIPPLDLLKNNIQPDDWVVLELANFQLIDINYSPHIAVCLLIEPEHLNWHEDMDEYVNVKQRLFAHQTAEDIAIFYGPNPYSQHAASISLGKQIPFMDGVGCTVEHDKVVINNQEICDVSDIKLLGKHNWQNVCAAVTAAWQVTQDIPAIKKAISSFVGLPHRLEPVREVDGVMYYNDSFSSAPTAASAALDTITNPKVLIVGGFDRGLDLGDLVLDITEHADDIRKLLLVGNAAGRIAQTLAEADFHNYEVVEAQTMEDIVARAREVAQNGDAVILSPGFPSFDMFKNFEERGIQYKSAVNGLE